MCCFSPVLLPISPLLALIDAILLRRRLKVGATRIFARLLPEGWQALAYSLRISARGDVAMILPHSKRHRSEPDTWIAVTDTERSGRSAL